MSEEDEITFANQPHPEAVVSIGRSNYGKVVLVTKLPILELEPKTARTIAQSLIESAEMLERGELPNWDLPAAPPKHIDHREP